MARQLYPKCNGDTCVLCRRKFASGDRVQVVNIVEKIGANPSNPQQVGSWLSSEFELRHVNCADPSLDGTIVLGTP